mgnify:CR=1 FL=1
MKTNVPDQAAKLRELAEQEDERTLQTPTEKNALSPVAPSQPKAPYQAIPQAPKAQAADNHKAEQASSHTTESQQAPAAPSPKPQTQAKPTAATNAKPSPSKSKPAAKGKQQESPSTNKETKETAAPAGPKQPSPKTAAQKSATPKRQSQTSPKNEPKATQMLKRFALNGKTQVIAISGGKGGVGKSNVACNLGIAMAQMKKNVLLMDADLSLANVDVLLGLTPRLNLSHVINGSKTLSEILVDAPAKMRLLPGGSGIEELSQLRSEQIERIFSGFNQLTPTPDVMIIDTAAGIHPNVLQFLLAADQTVVVTTPEPPAYTDAYALMKTIARHDPQKKIGIIVNMAKDWREAYEVTKLLMQICRRMLNVSFNNLGYIPRDACVHQAVLHQKPFLLKSPHSQASKSVRNIASTLLQVPIDNGRQRGLGHFFRRLIHRNGQTAEEEEELPAAQNS